MSTWFFLNSEIRQLRSCPGDGSCSNHGRCDAVRGSCICNPGFEGTHCEGQSEKDYLLYIFVLS